MKYLSRFSPDFKLDVLYTMLETAAEGGVVLLDMETKILFATHNASKMLRWDRQSLPIGEKFLSIVPFYNARGKQIANEQIPLNKVMKGGTQVMPFFSCLKFNGKLQLVVWRFYPIKTQTGEIVGIIAKIRPPRRDTTLESMKNTFISFAAHQLKTPSATVKGFLELLIGALPSTSSGMRYATQAFWANEQLISRSKNLLNLSKIEGGLIEPDFTNISINPLIEQTVIKYKPWLEKAKINVQLDFNTDQVEIASDETILRELFEVLFQNAIQYAPAESIITISTKKKGNKYYIQVIDQGPGLPKDSDFKTLLVKPAKNSEIIFGHNNHGLGLRLGYQLARVLNGKITLADAKNQGAVASIILPLD